MLWLRASGGRAAMAAGIGAAGAAGGTLVVGAGAVPFMDDSVNVVRRGLASSIALGLSFSLSVGSSSVVSLSECVSSLSFRGGRWYWPRSACSCSSFPCRWVRCR